MAGIANEGWSTALNLHHSVVQEDWEEHWSLLAVLFLTGSYYLAFDPGTLDCVLRENEDQFVVGTNGFIDTLMLVIANIEIFWCKPAAYALVLLYGE